MGGDGVIKGGDGEIVHADELDAMIDEPLCSVGGDGDEVAFKFGRIQNPLVGVVCA